MAYKTFQDPVMRVGNSWWVFYVIYDKVQTESAFATRPIENSARYVIRILNKNSWMSSYLANYFQKIIIYGYRQRRRERNRAPREYIPPF